MSESVRSDLEIDAGDVDLSESDRNALLSVARRRATLEALADRTAPVDLDDLSVAVATREFTAGTVDDGSVRDVELTLHHAHLPKMDDYGVVDYDPDTCTVERVDVRIGSLVE